VIFFTLISTLDKVHSKGLSNIIIFLSFKVFENFEKKLIPNFRFLFIQLTIFEFIHINSPINFVKQIPFLIYIFHLHFKTKIDAKSIIFGIFLDKHIWQRSNPF
jgi:hypothetical protein